MSVGGVGAGANKQIRYSVIIDTALAESKLRTLGINLKTTFESATPSVAKLGTGIQDVGNNMATTSAKSNTFTGALKTFDTTTKSTSGSVSILSSDFDKLATGGLTKTNTLAGQTTGSFDKLEKQTGKTTSRVDKLKEGFAGNRGLIYSMGTIFGTMTGVVAELQLMDDAHAQVAEATEKLTRLEAAGQKGTTAYTQAMQQKEKAERFASFTTRNLSLAVANFVPEILLLTTNLAKGGGIASSVAGAFGKLKGALGFGSAVTAMGGALSTVGVGGTAAGVGMEAAATGSRSLTAALAALAIPLIAITGGILLAQKLLEQDAKTVEEFAKANVKLTSVQTDSNKSFAEMNAIMRVTHMTMAEVIADPAKAAKAYHDMGGEVSANGEIVTKTSDQWNSAKAPLQQLWDMFKKGVGINDDVAAAVDKTANAIKLTDNVVNTHIPTVIHLTSSTKGLYKEGQYLEETYVQGAKTLDMYNLTQQQTGEKTNLLYGQFKQLNTIVSSGQANWIDFNDTLGEVAATMVDSSGNTTQFTNAIVAGADAIRNYEANLALANNTMGHSPLFTSDQDRRVGGLTKLINMLTASLNNTHEALLKQAQDLGATNGQLVKYADTTGLSTDQIKLQNVELTNIIHKLGGLTPAEEAAKKATEGHTTSLDDNTSSLEDRDKAIEEARKKQEAFTKAIADANKELESNALNLADALKVKLPDPDKFLKKLLKAFPKSIRKDMEVKIDLIAKKQELEKDFKDIISVALEANEKGEFVFDPNIVPDDTAADKFAKGLITDITKTFGNTSPTKFAVLQQKIQTAIASPKTGEELVKIFTEAGFLTKIEGAGTTMGENIGTAASKAFSDTWDPAIGFEGGGLDFGENEDIKQSAIVIPQSKVPAPDMSEFAQALNDMTKAAQDTATKISSLKYIFPPPDLAKFAGNINSALTGSKTITSKISSIKYDFPAPNLAKFAKNINSALSASKTITSKIQSIKYDFPPPNLAKFAKNINSALKAAKHIVDEINKLKPVIHVSYKVDPKPSGLSGSHASSANLNAHASAFDSNLNAHASSNGMLNVTIVNEDEFGQKKLKRFKSQLGKESYRFA